MKIIEKEEELRAIIKNNGFDYGIGATNNFFIVEFLDNKSGMQIRNPAYYNSPFEPIRQLQDFLNQIKFPASDCCIHLMGVCDKSKPLDIVSLDFELSPFLYYKKAETNKSTEK